jgi:uncharacterized metal-binding protein
MKIIMEDKPLVYSCSGCSSAAQMANYLALQLDKKDIAEMSCIAGVGGNVKKLVRTALSGRKIIAIDGCSLACSKACLGNHAINPDIHINLTHYGVKKRSHVDFDKNEANLLFNKIKAAISELIPMRQEEILYAVH